MRFDDRLQTLLDAPVADQRDRAVRWRQLVDLLSRGGASALSEAADRALELVRSDAGAIDEEIRAATVRSIAGRSPPPGLLRILAAQPLRVAAPLFAGMTLSAAMAEDILDGADPEMRALVTVTGEVADASVAPRDAPAAPGPPPADEAAPSISDMVERIEQLQRRRQPPAISAPAMISTPPAPAPTPPAPPHSQPGRRRADAAGRLFEWESDPSGHIAWVDGAPRGALVGRPLGGGGVALLEREAAPRLAQRHPFVDVPLAAGEVLAGQWSATGVPAFDPASGRFLGYRGLARRVDGAPPEAAGAAGATDMDALRELVHEIKTPLNAIIGFAEIIDGQYLGPAHLLYRERAATIVGQARHLLDAVEDLDFAARLRADRAGQSGGGKSGGGRLADVFPPIAAELGQCLAATGGILDVDVDGDRHRCAVSPELAARLLRRLLLSLCQLVLAGEVFRIAVSRRGAMCLLTIARPRVLSGIGEARLIDPAFNPVPGDLGEGEAAGQAEREGERGGGQGVGLGFALRLVRGLAKVAGGALVIDEQRITLELPAADG